MLQMPDILRNNDDGDDDADLSYQEDQEEVDDGFEEDIQMIIINN